MHYSAYRGISIECDVNCKYANRCNAVKDLAGPGFEFQTSRTRVNRSAMRNFKSAFNIKIATGYRILT